MTGHPYRCRTCQRGSPYVFCSNDCFRANPTKRSRSSCAVCSNRGGIVGNIDSNRICPRCRKDPANSKWVRAPRREFNGFDADFFEAASRGLEMVESRPHRGPLAIRIVRLIAGGVRYREIVELLQCSRQYVDKVATYWNKETDGRLRMIRQRAIMG